MEGRIIKRTIGLLMMVGLMVGVVGLGGCGDSKPTEPSREELLVGVWGERKFDDNLGIYVQNTLTFYEDDSYRRVILYEGNLGSWTSTGTWKFKDQLQLILYESILYPSQLWIDLNGNVSVTPRGEMIHDYTLEENRLTLVNDVGYDFYYERK
jgi:hypothetical protein